MPFLQNQRVFKGAILSGRHAVELMLEFAQRHSVKPAIKEYPLTTEGIEKAIKDSESNKVRYRAVLVPQH
ncbi:hypothetical protein VTP01DRAFT_8240 [Rhizomucor pusillus]|uniref:uncharacterized protein n=1 Tax=Rhizomucor pusillus TaxID=4840 RepID=UPI003742DA53